MVVIGYSLALILFLCLETMPKKQLKVFVFLFYWVFFFFDFCFFVFVLGGVDQKGTCSVIFLLQKSSDNNSTVHKLVGYVHLQENISMLIRSGQYQYF